MICAKFVESVYIMESENFQNSWITLWLTDINERTIKLMKNWPTRLSRRLGGILLVVEGVVKNCVHPRFKYWKKGLRELD